MRLCVLTFSPPIATNLEPTAVSNDYSWTAHITRFVAWRLPVARDQHIDYPVYLQSLPDFEAYIADHFQDLNSTVRGRRFADAALLILPHLSGTDVFTGYHLNPKQSHDGGIDIFSELREDGERLACQSKLNISSTEQLDSIMSKFYVFEREAQSAHDDMLFSDDITPPVTYAIVTGSDLAGIRRRYEEKRPSSFSFYKELNDAGRIIFIDGKDILNWMRRTYARSTTLPASFQLKSSKPWLNVGDVHIGVLTGQSLIDLVRQ